MFELPQFYYPLGDIDDTYFDDDDDVFETDEQIDQQEDGAHDNKLTIGERLTTRNQQKNLQERLEKRSEEVFNEFNNQVAKFENLQKF